MIGDERVLEGVLNDEEVFLKVSPALYFEVLLRGSLKELETAGLHRREERPLQHPCLRHVGGDRAIDG